MSDSDTFNKSENENKLFSYKAPFDTDGDINYSFDSSMANFFLLTHNGNLKFIFNPDKNATHKELALCIVDQNSISYTQVANNTWSVSMNIKEVW